MSINSSLFNQKQVSIKYKIIINLSADSSNFHENHMAL